MNFIAYLLEYNRFYNIVGIATILAIAFLFSRKKTHINIRLVFSALTLQFLIGFLVLKTVWGRLAVSYVASGVSKMYQFADQGATFVFGNLANSSGAWGFIFAIKVLPVIIFFGAVTALLFHWGIIQAAVRVINFCIRPLLGTSGAETLCASANSFLGQTEAPLLVRKYLKDMTQSEMLVVMVSGMATISGSILVVFAAMGVPAEHMLASSVMAIPGSILIARILLPETEKAHTQNNDNQVVLASDSHNALGAIATGTFDGLNLALNVGAMLIAFLGLLGLANYAIAQIGVLLNYLFSYMNITLLPENLSLNVIFAYVLAPFGYLLGFTGNEALIAGQLIGTKVAVNELIAFGEMTHLQLSARTIDIITYALCGFSNFSCIGIQIGGIGALVPEKKGLLAQLGLYAVLGGALTNLLSAMIAGLLL